MSKYSLLLCLLWSAFLVSCSDKITPEGPPPPGEGAVSVSTPDIVLSGTGQRASFTLTAQGNWFIGCFDPQGTPGWFTVSQNSGDAGTVTVEVTAAEENPYPEDRNAFIRIRSGTSVALVTVTQKKPHAIVASKDRAELEPGAEDFSINMQSGESGYQVEIPPQYTHWLIRQTGSSTTERFRATANGTGKSRTGEIVFTDGERADTVRVYQKGQADSFLLEESIYHNHTSAEDIEMNVASGVEFEATIVDNPDRWLSGLKRTLPGRAPRVDRAYFSLSYHIDPKGRRGTITVKDIHSGVSEEITVVQAGMSELVVYPEGEYIALADGETFTARVSRDHEYNATVPPMFAEWLSVGNREDDGFERPWKLPVTIRPNETNYVREGYVLLESENKTVSDTIRITQLCNPDDRGILTAFYESTGGSGWTRNDNWLSDLPLDQWYGITTDGEGRVTAIDLPNNRLSGQIPDYSVDLLERLEKLDLSHNGLTGVTGRVGYLPELRYFDISENQITGTVPESFADLFSPIVNNVAQYRYMELFRVNDNFYTGAIPGNYILGHSVTNCAHYFDMIKQKGEGFEPITNLRVSEGLPNVEYTDIAGQRVSLHDFCTGNNYNVLFRSAAIDDQVIEHLQKLNSLTKASIPGYSIGVIWDVADARISLSEIEATREKYSLSFTIASGEVGSIRELFKFTDKDEFYLVNDQCKVIKFNYGLDWIYNYLLPSDLYFSQDYSKDKTWRTVQTATVGAGVDIVFMGDGFTDLEINDGSYDRYAEAAFDALFTIEPFKSLRPRYNLYVVYAVSRNSDYNHTSCYTLFGARPQAEGAYMGINQYGYDVWPEYAACAPIRDIRKTTIMIAVNYRDARGVAIPHSSGGGVAFTTSGTDIEQFRKTMVHEMGHAFAGLEDEYITYSNETPTDYYIETKQFLWLNYGTDANEDFTDDPTIIKWKHFIGHPKYPYVGAFEGVRHRKGVWRPEELSIMGNSNYQYFNAPSREAIYKRTVTLGGETYSFEAFVAQDHVTPPANYQP